MIDSIKKSRQYKNDEKGKKRFYTFMPNFRILSRDKSLRVYE